MNNIRMYLIQYVNEYNYYNIQNILVTQHTVTNKLFRLLEISFNELLHFGSIRVNSEYFAADIETTLALDKEKINISMWHSDNYYRLHYYKYFYQRLTSMYTSGVVI